MSTEGDIRALNATQEREGTYLHMPFEAGLPAMAIVMAIAMAGIAIQHQETRNLSTTYESAPQG